MTSSNLIRTARGHIVSYPDRPTLQDWIAQGRVTDQDEIYDPDEDRWIRVAEVADLLGFVKLREASLCW